LRRKPIPTDSAGRGEEILTPSGRTGTVDRAPRRRARSANKPFAEWNEVFPDSSSFAALANRLPRRAGIVKIQGDCGQLNTLSNSRFRLFWHRSVSFFL
jgi:hypothetical protein